MINCPQCTLENPPDLKKCAICDCLLPSSSSSSSKKKTFVQCPQCTLENPSTAKKCAVCDANLAGSAASPVVVGGRGVKKEVKVVGEKKEVEKEVKKVVVKELVKKEEKKEVKKIQLDMKKEWKMEVDQEGEKKKVEEKKGKTPISLLFEQLKCPEWRNELRIEFGKPYISKLEGFLRQEELGGKKIFPPLGMVFEALNRCPLSKVRVVMLGQVYYSFFFFFKLSYLFVFVLFCFVLFCPHI